MTNTDVPKFVITEPGVYDIPEAAYHADPVPGGSLSSTVARHLLPPSCPALAKWRHDHPEFKDAYDLGSVVHAMILRSGPEIVEVKFDAWSTNAAKSARAEARERGAIALLSKDLRRAEAMAAAVHEHPRAGLLFAAGTGAAEQTTIWRDETTGQLCRAMLDWTRITPGRPALIVDLKTTTSVAPRELQRTVEKYSYYQQAEWYARALRSRGHDPQFVFCFVMKDPPHLVDLVELDDDTWNHAARRNDQALAVWRDCREADDWPGFRADDPEPTALIGLSRWAYSD